MATISCYRYVWLMWSTFILVLLQHNLLVIAQPGGFMKDLSDFTLSTSQEVDSFFECPLHATIFRSKCEGFPMSCRGRCGTMINGHVSFLEDTSITCSCDAVCRLYRDCCWDFEINCPNEAEKNTNLQNTIRRLDSTKIECQQGTAVITVGGQVGGRGDEGNDWTQRDFREPVVYLNGLQFENSSVYKFFLDDNRGVHSSVAWKKQVRSSMPIPYKDLELFIIEGKASKTIRDALEDIPPKGIDKRFCKANAFVVECKQCGEYQKKISVDIGNLSKLCKEIGGGETQTYSTTTGLSSTTEIQYHSSTNFQIVTGKASNNEPDRGCFTFFASDIGRRTNTFLFSMLISFTATTGFRLDGYQGTFTLNWKSLEYIGSEDQSAKRVVIVCSPGFIFNDAVCTRPTTLRVDISIDSYKSQVLIDSIRGLMDLFVENFQTKDFKIDANGKVDNCFKLRHGFNDERKIIFGAEFQILNYSLTYNGSVLPMTRDVIDTVIKLQQTSKSADSSKQNTDGLTLILCLTTSSVIQTYNLTTTATDEILFCDHLLWVGDQLRTRHLKLMTPEVSVESLDDILLSSPLTEDNKHFVLSKSGGKALPMGGIEMFPLILGIVFVF